MILSQLINIQKILRPSKLQVCFIIILTKYIYCDVGTLRWIKTQFYSNILYTTFILYGYTYLQVRTFYLNIKKIYIEVYVQHFVITTLN